jgi:hypothetical protein
LYEEVDEKMARLIDLDDVKFLTMAKHEEPFHQELLMLIDWRLEKSLAIGYFEVEQQEDVQRIYHGMIVN